MGRANVLAIMQKLFDGGTFQPSPALDCLRRSPLDSYAAKYACSGRRHLRWSPSAPLLPSMSAAGVSTLWFIGDSVLMQVAFMAACRARAESTSSHEAWAWARPHWAWLRNDKAAGGINCAGDPHHNRRVCFLTAVGHSGSPTIAQTISILMRKQLTARGDVAIVTPGAWRVDNASQHVTITSELLSLITSAQPTLPTIIYHEPLAAHFPTVDGWWQPGLGPSVQCAPLAHRTPPPAIAAVADLLRAARAVGSLDTRLAVMQGAWQWSAEYTDAHPGPQPDRGTSDCTHYCLSSGVADALVTAVAHQLHTLANSSTRAGRGGNDHGQEHDGRRLQEHKVHNFGLRGRTSGGHELGPVRGHDEEHGEQGGRQLRVHSTSGQRGGRRLRAIETAEGLGAPLLGLAPGSTATGGGSGYDSAVPSPSRAMFLTPGARAEWRDMDSSSKWAAPSQLPNESTIVTPRGGAPQLALCLFGVAGVVQGKAAQQLGLSTRAVFAAADSHIAHVLEPAERRGWHTSVFAHSWAGNSSRISAAVEFAYGARLAGAMHEPFGRYTSERVTSMLLSITASLRLARSHAATILAKPYDLVVLARHDVYFFRDLTINGIDPNAFTTAAWCSWLDSEQRTPGRCGSLSHDPDVDGVLDLFFIGGQACASPAISHRPPPSPAISRHLPPSPAISHMCSPAPLEPSLPSVCMSVCRCCLSMPSARCSSLACSAFSGTTPLISSPIASRLQEASPDISTARWPTLSSRAIS